MIGGTMSGYCAIGSPVIATKPSRTVRIEMTMATMGRSMKKRDMASLPRRRLRRRRCRGRLLRRRFRRIHRHARLDAGEPFHHHPVPGMETGLDHPLRAEPLAGLHGADLGLVVAPHHRHLRAALQIVDRALRHYQCTLLDLGHAPDLGVLARPQQVARIREHGDDGDRAGLDLHLPAFEQHAPLVRKDRAVGEGHLQVVLLRRVGLLLDAPPEGQVLLLAELVGDADRSALRDRGEQRRRAHQVAHLLLRDAGDAADRRGHPRPPLAQARLVHGRPSCIGRRLRRALRRECVVELLLADRLAGGQRAETLDVLVCLGELCLGLRQIGLRLLELRLGLPRIDGEEQIALVDEAPFGIDPPQQVAVDLGPDLGVDVSFGRADPLPDDRDVRLHDRSDHHRRRRRRRRLGLLLRTALPTKAQGGQSQGDSHAGDLLTLHALSPWTRQSYAVEAKTEIFVQNQEWGAVDRSGEGISFIYAQYARQPSVSSLDLPVPLQSGADDGPRIAPRRLDMRTLLLATALFLMIPALPAGAQTASAAPEAPKPETQGAVPAAAARDENLPPSEQQAKAALEKSPRHGEYVDIKLPSGGHPVRAWIVYPERKDKAGVVILIHEIFGLSDWLRGVADQLARDGFIAIAPDLISGLGPNGGGTESAASRDDVVALVRAITPDDATAKLNAVR